MMMDQLEMCGALLTVSYGVVTYGVVTNCQLSAQHHISLIYCSLFFLYVITSHF